MGHITDRTVGSRFGSSYRYYDEIESTNVEAKSLASSGAPEGTVVIAEAQTAGRGRLGRRWTSPAGKGLLFSVLLRPALPMSDAHLLTLVAACAAAEAIESLASTPVKIKWPNDLFIGDRKAGGILLEVAGEQDEVDWIVVGIGVNVNTEYSELPVALRRTATSLKMASGAAGGQKRAARPPAAGARRALRRRRRQRVRARAQRLPPARLPAEQGRQRADTREGPVAGRAAGIDERGALLVELPQRQIRRFHSGDVTLQRLSADPEVVRPCGRPRAAAPGALTAVRGAPRLSPPFTRTRLTIAIH